jgi:hypothetical protein
MSRRVVLGAAGACAVGKLVSTSKAVDTHALAWGLLTATGTGRGWGAGLLLGGAELLLELVKLGFDGIHIDAHGTNGDTGAGREIGTQNMPHAAQVKLQLILGESELLVVKVGVLEIDLGPKTAGPLKTHASLPEPIDVGRRLAELRAGEQEGMSANELANPSLPLLEGALLAIKLERIEVSAACRAQASLGEGGPSEGVVAETEPHFIGRSGRRALGDDTLLSLLVGMSGEHEIQDGIELKQVARRNVDYGTPLEVLGRNAPEWTQAVEPSIRTRSRPEHGDDARYVQRATAVVSNNKETSGEEESHERVQPISAQLGLKGLVKLDALVDEVGCRRRQEELQALRADVDLVGVLQLHPARPKHRSANWDSCGQHKVPLTGSRSGISRDEGRELARMIRSHRNGLETELQAVELIDMSRKSIIGDAQALRSGPTGANRSDWRATMGPAWPAAAGRDRPCRGTVARRAGLGSAAH